MNLLYILVSVVLLETSYLTYKQLAKHTIKSHRSRIVCDTSALIDGRIVTIAQSGFLSSELIIPHSVSRELQYMADRADHDKRERARYGLDVIAQLQTVPHVSVVVYDDGTVHPDGVDEQLIVLAKKLGARLCTTDYNLNKVARTESVVVVNVNELAHALRPMHLPGETIQVAVVAAGQNKDQGVGYLDDGTMVVIDRAKRVIGQTVEAETTRVIQTEAGRMVFATLVGRSRVSTPRSSRSKPAPHRVATRGRSHEERLVNLANTEQSR